MATTQERVDALIMQIKDATAAGSVTNGMVAEVLSFISSVIRYVNGEMQDNVNKAVSSSQNAATSVSNLSRDYNEWFGKVSVLTQILRDITLSPEAGSISAVKNYASLADGHTNSEKVEFLNGASEAFAGLMTADHVKKLKKAVDAIITELKPYQGENYVKISLKNDNQELFGDIMGATKEQAGVMTITHVKALEAFDTWVKAIRKWLGLSSDNPEEWDGNSLNTQISNLSKRIDKATLKGFESEEAYNQYAKSEDYDPEQLCGIYEEE